MNEDYDKFPVNLCESSGPIKKNAFFFRYKNFDVWQDGKCLFSGNAGGRIFTKLNGNKLVGTVIGDHISKFMHNEFSFGEISTNLDRILWSKDLFNRLRDCLNFIF